MIPVQKHLRSEAGFTLVELAIVMIIIGLLIAGVLKGQALIQNAQVTATVAQSKAIEAAISTFRDTFNALPGDMTGANNRLPNCAGVCSAVAGNGDGQLNNTPAQTPIAKEGEAFFVQLNSANLLSGLAPAAAGSTTIGANFPAAKVSNNVIMAGYSPLGAVADFGGLIGAGLPQSGLYLEIGATIGAPAVANIGLTPDQALRIDTKLDDADPSAGYVRGWGATAAAGGLGCGSAAAAGVSGTYLTNNSNTQCGLFVRVQN